MAVFPVLGCSLQSAPDGNRFSMITTDHTWTQAPDFRPYLELVEGALYFDAAQTIHTEPYVTGLGEGFRTLYDDFPQMQARFETLVWREHATGFVHCTFVPLDLHACPVQSVQWPGPLVADMPGSYAVVPQMQGYLLPVDWPEEAPRLPFHGQMASTAAYMPWFGEITPEGGYLAYCCQSWDTAYDVAHPAGGPTRIQARHLPSLGRMDTPRTICYAFTPAGSTYVSLCKIYRQIVRENGLFVSLREKAARCETVDRLIGTSVVHVGTKTHVSPDSAYYDAEHPEKNDSLTPFAVRAARMYALREAGAGRLYLHLDGWGEPGYDNKHPDYLPPCEDAGGWAGLRALQSACHDLDCLFGLHDQYRDYYLDAPTYDAENAVHLPDGTIPELARWAGGRQQFLCAALAPGYVRRNFETLMAEGIHPDCVYLDVFTCNEPDECAHPHHVVTRREALDYRLQCFDYMIANRILPSSEEVADWSMERLVFCHWAPYAKGGIPVPLFNLVYHDCVLIPWMLDKGRWGTPEGQSGFLHALLNGGMGYLNSELMGDALQENIGQCRVVSDLQERVAYQEMVSHVFLTEDRSVQRTTFADGVTVTVDFAKESYEIR